MSTDEKDTSFRWNRPMTPEELAEVREDAKRWLKDAGFNEEDIGNLLFPQGKLKYKISVFRKIFNKILGKHKDKTRILGKR